MNLCPVGVGRVPTGCVGHTMVNPLISAILRRFTAAARRGEGRRWLAKPRFQRGATGFVSRTGDTGSIRVCVSMQKHPQFTTSRNPNASAKVYSRRSR